MSETPSLNERPLLQTSFRRSFTVPARQLSFHEKAGLDKTDANADLLYSHPSARVIKFSPPTESIKSTSKAEVPADTDYPIDAVETLPWRSRTETLIATGLLLIEKVRGSTNFLKCQDIMHAILRNSQCWCVDGESKFVLRVRAFQYYRIELPSTTEEDKAKVEELKKVFPTVLRFERTPCPFIRAFTVDLPDDAITPRRKGQWKRRDSSQPNTPDTETPSSSRRRSERSWSTRVPPTSYPKGGPRYTMDDERGRIGRASNLQRRGSQLDNVRNSSPASFGLSEDGTDSEHQDSGHDSELESAEDRSRTSSPWENLEPRHQNEKSPLAVTSPAAARDFFRRLTSTDDKSIHHSAASAEASTSPFGQALPEPTHIGDAKVQDDNGNIDTSVWQDETSSKIAVSTEEKTTSSNRQDGTGEPSSQRETFDEAINSSNSANRSSKVMDETAKPVSSSLKSDDQSTKERKTLVHLAKPDNSKDVKDAVIQSAHTTESDTVQLETRAPSSRVDTPQTAEQEKPTVANSVSDEKLSNEPLTKSAVEGDHEPGTSQSLAERSRPRGSDPMSLPTSESESETDQSSSSDSENALQPVTGPLETEEKAIGSTEPTTEQVPPGSVRNMIKEDCVVEPSTSDTTLSGNYPSPTPLRTEVDLEHSEGELEDNLSPVSSIDSFHTMASTPHRFSISIESDTEDTPIVERRMPFSSAALRHRRDRSDVTVTVSSGSEPVSPEGNRLLQQENEQTPTLLRSSASDASWPEPTTPSSATKDPEGIRQRFKARQRSFSPLPPASTIFTGSQIRHDSGSGHMTKAILQKIVIKPIEVALLVVHILTRIANGATVNDLLSGELFKRPEHQRTISGFADQLNSGKGSSDTEDDYGIPIRGRRGSSERRMAMVFDDETEDGFEDLD